MTDLNTSLASSGYLLSLFGASSSPASAPIMSALAGYQPYVADENQKIQTYSQQTQVQQDVTYFQNNISKVKSVADLTNDPKLLAFITKAFGLDADSAYPAKIAAVLNSNLSDTTSYANSLLDPRYQQLAKEFNVATNGMPVFSNGSVTGDVVNRYLTNSYEESLDSTNPALRDAAYFLRNVGNIKSAYDILGDPVLRSVFETTTGLPAEIANLPVQDEASLVSSKVDITQFETSHSSATGSGTATPTALSLAQSDLSQLATTTAKVTAAQTAVQSVVNQIQAIQQSYGNLAAIQDPNGQFAAQIPVQEAAAPTLVDQQGLLATAQSATGTVTANIKQLQALIQQVGNPNNTAPVSQLQAEFATLVTETTAAVSGASYQFDNGTGGASTTSQNLLDGSMTGPVSVQYDSKGDAVTVNPQDLGSSSSFQQQLSAAASAFQAITGSGDGTNIQAASAALTGAQSAANVVSQSVATDAANFQTAIAGVPQWAGTYDTAGLYRGTQSLADAGSRVTQINQLLSQIQNMAQQASQMADTADHSALQTQYTQLIGQLGQAINQPGATNVDNLLVANPGGTPGYYSYGLDTSGKYQLQASTSDLASGVLTPLQNLDVSSAADAGSVISAVTGSIQTAMAQTGTHLGIDSQVFSLAGGTLDPRAAVDNQYRQLATNMPNIVSQAASGGANLLDTATRPITLTVSSTNQSFTIAPETFDQNVTQVLSAGSQALPSGPNDQSGAIAQLAQAGFSASNVLDDLTGELNQLKYSTGITQANIGVLQKQQSGTSATAGLPVKSTAFAQQFVQKYLATIDAQNAAAGSGSDSYLVQLMQPTQTLDQTVASAISLGTNLNLSV